LVELHLVALLHVVADNYLDSSNEATRLRKPRNDLSVE
jgi:hypothetical protein